MEFKYYDTQINGEVERIGAEIGKGYRIEKYRTTEPITYTSFGKTSTDYFEVHVRDGEVVKVETTIGIRNSAKLAKMWMAHLGEIEVETGEVFKASDFKYVSVSRARTKSRYYEFQTKKAASETPHRAVIRVSDHEDYMNNIGHDAVKYCGYMLSINELEDNSINGVYA